MRIWKFHIPAEDRVTLKMPAASEILSLDVQNVSMHIWAKCDPYAKKIDRYFAVVGTGHAVPLHVKKYIGTAVVPPFVWHVFELFGDDE